MLFSSFPTNYQSTAKHPPITLFDGDKVGEETQSDRWPDQQVELPKFCLALCVNLLRLVIRQICHPVIALMICLKGVELLTSQLVDSCLLDIGFELFQKRDKFNASLSIEQSAKVFKYSQPHPQI